mmetsp:Transcript_15256/g.24134  ORF Transcript_15256/g.24134 Transcript_15256/m.24134 type:complete len:101 (+) Transcript_15256:3305-3607(+)
MNTDSDSAMTNFHIQVDTLCLEHCRQLTDKAIVSLSEHYGKELKYINVSFCEKLTDGALVALQRCRNLRSLFIIGCPLFTSKAMRTLQGSVRNLSIYPAT